MNLKRIIIAVMAPVILALLVKSINVFSFFIAEKIYPLIYSWDRDNTFLVLSIHHIIQAVIALVIITSYGRIRKISLKDYGFRKEGFCRSIKFVAIFILFWTFIQTFSGYILVKYYNEPLVFGFPLTTGNFLGRLAFQMVLSGTSEEILFRVMVIAILSDLLKNQFSKTTLFIYLISISTIIFMFDHINFALSPIRITHFNILQQITLLIFGSFYGWVFIKYKNYWSVAIAHNMLNGIISLSTLLLYSWLN